MHKRIAVKKHSYNDDWIYLKTHNPKQLFTMIHN